ncbi:hypothetical protein E2320_014312 [Naja naja]|nr:hypothetical protein E2320_014312 [Naja naja]
MWIIIQAVLSGDRLENDNKKQMWLMPMETANLQVEEVIFDHQQDANPQEKSYSEDQGARSSTYFPIEIQQDQKGKQKGEYSKRGKSEFDLAEYGRSQSKGKPYDYRQFS